MSRRALALISVVVAMVMIDLIVVAIVVAGARDHDLTVRRIETMAAFYACEAGSNMAIREMLQDPDGDGIGTDEDGTGVVGEISDNANPDDDPVVGLGRVYVSKVTAGDETTLTSIGRSGSAQRKMDTVVQ